MRVDLVVTSLGLVSPVGEGVVASAAAQRAGLAKPKPLPGVTVELPFALSDEEMAEPLVVSVVGHRVTPLTDGFTQTGLWLRLAVAATRDLLGYGRLPAAADPFWDRTLMYGVLPNVDSPRFGWPADEVLEIVESRYLRLLAELAPIAGRIERARVRWAHAGAASALMDVASLVQGGSVDRVCLASVDSYCDFPTVKTLMDDGRLKSPDVQTGMQPGEAAAMILIERREAARSRGAEGSASIVSARHEKPANEPPSSAPSDDPTSGGDHAAYFVQAGILWAKVITEALTDAGISRFAGDIIVDLNGEEWRASAWGMAQVRLQNVIDFAACKLVVPCASFGEIGAASGVAGVCLAARSFARDYATGDATLVVSLSENGEVGAIVVGRPPKA